jgi:hypothetical protein
MDEVVVSDDTAPVVRRRKIPSRYRCKFICLGLLIEPVRLPCGHIVCHACFDSILELSNLTCPACRTRLNLWVRQRHSNVVDAVRAARSPCRFDDDQLQQALWQEIRARFPEEVSMSQAEQADLEFSGSTVAHS